MEEKTLSVVFDELIRAGALPASRVAPCKTALRQYAAVLGSDFERCPAKLFNKPAAERNKLIERGLSRTNRSRKTGSAELSGAALRNAKNNVSYVLRRAAESSIISAVSSPPEVASSQDARNKIGTRGVPARGEVIISAKYSLDPVLPALRNEIEVYKRWCISEFNPQRPRNLKRREVSFNQSVAGLLRLAGYWVKFGGVSVESISLAYISRPERLEGYVQWFIEQRGKCTGTITRLCGSVSSLTRYLSIVSPGEEERREFEEQYRQLQKLKERLPDVEKVQDKSKRWLSLKALEAVGCAFDPLNPAWGVKAFSSCESSLRKLRRVINLFNEGNLLIKEGSLATYGAWAAHSLMLRVLVRVPLRQRNLREMLWNPTRPEEGSNLYRCNGRWRLRYTGAQLKIARRGGKTNSVDYELPADITSALEAWLYKWRPLVASRKPTLRSDKYGSVPAPPPFGQQHVFVGRGERPYSDRNLGEAINKLTYKHTGVAVNPHMIRTIWATEYILATGDFVGAAYMLNDKVETVLKNYAELLNEEVATRAQSWLVGRLAS